MANVPLNIDVLFVAALAPILGVVAFWFLQMFFIEIQKRMLSRLRHRHEAFCRFTNYIGILFQTICQALGYTVTRSGIAAFQVTVNYGKVEPKKEKKGVFEWVARSFLLFGPFFIPAGLVLLVSYFIIGKGFVFPTLVQYTFVESLTGFWVSLSTFAIDFAGFLINIDLLNPLHVGFLFVLLFFGLGIRPSYIGQERKEKIDILHDLRHIKDHLVEKPLYILAIILILYVFYVLSLFLKPVLYVGLFTILGWMSLTAVIAILLTFPVLFLIKATDEIRPHWKLIPFVTLAVSYVLARVFFIYFPTKQVEPVSLLVMLLSTILMTILLIKYKRTNRFKTATKMKHVRVADGKKRTPKK
jgi:ABC-type multidrug transport system fused ATPase/permease subunit